MKKQIKQILYYKMQIHGYRLLFCIFFLGVWEFLSDFQYIDKFFFSSPKEILYLLYTDLKSGTLVHHLSITAYETASSFLLVTIISLVISSMLWFMPLLSKVIEPYLIIFNSLPKSAMAPLFIVWFGTGSKTIIIAGMSVAIFGSIINYYQSFQSCDSEKLFLIQSLNGNYFQSFRYVCLPYALPMILSTCKINVGLCLVGVIIGEFLVAQEGIGYLIIYGSQVFKINQVIAYITLLCIVAYIIYQLICIIEKKIAATTEINL